MQKSLFWALFENCDIDELTLNQLKAVNCLLNQNQIHPRCFHFNFYTFWNQIFSQNFKNTGWPLPFLLYSILFLWYYSKRKKYNGFKTSLAFFSKKFITLFCSKVDHLLISSVSKPEKIELWFPNKLSNFKWLLVPLYSWSLYRVNSAVKIARKITFVCFFHKFLRLFVVNVFIKTER